MDACVHGNIEKCGKAWGGVLNKRFHRGEWRSGLKLRCPAAASYWCVDFAQADLMA